MKRLRSRMALPFPMAVCLLAAGSAQAAEVWRDLPAAGMSVLSLSVGPFQALTVETVGLSAGADTVLHLALQGAPLASNDDTAGGLGSRVVWINSTGVTQYVTGYLHAYSEGTQGYADVLVNGRLHVSHVWAGGTRLTQPCGGTQEWRTARAANRIPDPLLLGLDANLNLVTLDDDGGTGLDARIGGTPPAVCSVVVGNYGSTYATGVHVYRSAPTFDFDLDGLSSDLESALGTCDLPGCMLDTPNPRDTDLDGLPDAAEVFGVDDAIAPQYLPQWGADPRHKDMFIEADTTSDIPANALTPAVMQGVADHFMEDRYNAVGNPDGLPGVRVHFDAGQQAPPQQATLFGSWGGSTQVPAGTDYKTAPASYRAPVRTGLFRYVLIADGAGGQTSGTPGDRSVVGYQGGVAVLTHELGHTVNLKHHGHDSWGQVNCKPQYRSVMNYAYQGVEGFSTTDDFEPLNPTAVDEQDYALGLGGYPTWLVGDPYYLRVQGTGIDFNRDGYILPLAPSPAGPTGWARTEVNWATWVGCDSYTQNKQKLSGDTAPSTPSLVRRGDRLFAFWVGVDQRIRYRQGWIGTSKAHGSCPTSDALSASCMTWGTEQIVPTQLNAYSVSAVVDGSRVVLAYRTTADSLRVIQAPSVNAAGNLTGWANDTWIASARTTQEPEIQALEVQSALFGGSSRVLAVVYRNQSDSTYRMITAPGGTGPWTSRGALRDTSGANLNGTFGASLATLPDGANSRTCGAFTDVQSAVTLYCYDKSTDRWRAESAAFTSAGGSAPVVSSRPGLVWHTWRTTSGEPMYGDATFGQFRLAIAKPNGTTPNGVLDLYQSGPYSRARNPVGALQFTSFGKFADDWRTTRPGTGIELYEDLSLGALKGLYVESGDAPANHALQFLPLADATFNADLTSGDDFRVMATGVCLGLRDRASCGL